jgi:hypothetical protein
MNTEKVVMKRRLGTEMRIYEIHKKFSVYWIPNITAIPIDLAFQIKYTRLPKVVKKSRLRKQLLK